MSMLTNDSWAQGVVSQLINNGVYNFCIAPGSRSTPLSLAVSREKRAKSTVHFDERGLGFYALGIAKTIKEPVVLIVTSGTALGNLYPAVMEAYHSQLPLILLTADRSPEERDCFANQTTDQIKFFGAFVKWHVDLPPPGLGVTLAFLHSMINHAVYQSRLTPGGPVHINCMFRKPLTSETAPLPLQRTLPSHLVSKRYLSDEGAVTLTNLINKASQGLILIGQLVDRDELLSIHELANTLQWPVVADLLSSPFPKGPCQIENHDLLFSNLCQPPLTTRRPDLILHFGKSFISQAVIDYLAQSPPKDYIHIDKDSFHVDPAHLTTLKVGCDIPHLTGLLTSLCEKKEREGLYLDDLMSLDQACKESIATYFTKTTELTEPLFFYQLIPSLMQHLQSSKSVSLFIGNSMPIRNAERFLSRVYPLTIYANRGLSGIDGNIATAIGIASATQEPLLALIGDQTFLHDINSLGLLKELSTPITFIVFNNQGGAIFSNLPVSKKADKTVLDRYFHAKHQMEFSAIASQFQIEYSMVGDLEELYAAYRSLTKKGLHRIVEVVTSLEKDLAASKELSNNVQQTCQSALYTVS